jgi:predicted RNase H-like HicB family nuclease
MAGSSSLKKARTAIQAPYEAGESHRFRETCQRRPPADLEQYPQTGRSQVKYQVVIVKGPSSYGAMVPDLPGVYAVGKTANETRERIAGAIDLHIRGLIADGEPVPPPSVAELVEVAI